MYGMLGLLNPKWAKAERERARKYRADRLATAEFVPWDPRIKWQPRLNIQGATYPVFKLFDVETNTTCQVNSHRSDQVADSPTGRWRYALNAFPVGEKLRTWYGARIGDVMFDSVVVIPAIYGRDYGGKKFDHSPWMSLTPAEYISMRGGTRRAKGRVIIAGLGMGYQLIEVAKRKQVKEIVLIEKDQEIVDWILPELRRVFPEETKKIVEIVVGDAMKEIPKLTADVALVDIFKGYGSNHWERDDLRRDSKDVGYIWVWGAADVPDSTFY